MPSSRWRTSGDCWHLEAGGDQPPASRKVFFTPLPRKGVKSMHTRARKASVPDILTGRAGGWARNTQSGVLYAYSITRPGVGCR